MAVDTLGAAAATAAAPAPKASSIEEALRLEGVTVTKGKRSQRCSRFAPPPSDVEFVALCLSMLSRGSVPAPKRPSSPPPPTPKNASPSLLPPSKPKNESCPPPSQRPSSRPPPPQKNISSTLLHPPLAESKMESSPPPPSPPPPPPKKPSSSLPPPPLREPKMDSSPPTPPPLFLHKCPECDKAFRSPHALGGHKAIHRRPATSDDTASNGPAAPSGGEKAHECQICWRTFSTGQALGGHKRRHYNGTPGSAVGAGSSSDSTAAAAATVPASSEGARARHQMFDLNLPPLSDEDNVEVEGGLMRCVKAEQEVVLSPVALKKPRLDLMLCLDSSYR